MDLLLHLHTAIGGPRGRDGLAFAMRLHRRLIGCAAAFALMGSAAGAEIITDARYTTPVERYGHFAAGRPHEYARLRAGTNTGRVLELELPADEVFEDVAPRLIRLAADEPESILAIVSQRAGGARLVLIGLGGEGLAISAQSAAIGTPMRWLNPVGVADLDGDGRAEIAAVITPHLNGTLKLYRREAERLVEIAALGGFSNHVYGTPELALSLPLPIAGRMHLLVPDTARLQLRVIALAGGRLVETGRCAVTAPITGPIRQVSPRAASVGTRTGPQVVLPGDCLGERRAPSRS